LRDPFLTGELLENLKVRFGILKEEIADDLEQHASAASLHGLVSSAQGEAERLATTARGDRIPDSRETSDCLARIEKLASELADAGRLLEGAHEDWNDLQARLRACHLRVSEVTVELRNDLRARGAVHLVRVPGWGVRAGKICENRKPLKS